MNTQTVQEFLRVRWRRLVTYGAVFGGLGVLQFVLLGSLLSGFSTHEVQAYWAAASVHNILEVPLNAPFSLLAHLFLHFWPQSLFVLRLTAALFGFAVLMIFFALTKAWYGERTAVLGTALFGSSSWYLHSARLGTAGVLMFGLFVLAAAAAWARRTERPLAWLACFAVAAGLLYVPGMIWFLVAGVFWRVRFFGGLAWQRRWVTLSAGLVTLLMLAPLTWAMYRTPRLIQTWLGFPAKWASVGTELHNIAVVPLHIVAWGPGLPEHWLGHVPMLDVFSIVMLVFGVAALTKHSRRLAIGFALLLVLGCVLVGIGGSGLGVLAPFAYLLVAGGVHEMLGRWLHVFPRNPIARQLGVGLITLVVIASCAYNIRAYFIAWPQSRVTESAFIYHHP